MRDGQTLFIFLISDLILGRSNFPESTLYPPRLTVTVAPAGRIIRPVSPGIGSGSYEIARSLSGRGGQHGAPGNENVLPEPINLD